MGKMFSVIYWLNRSNVDLFDQLERVHVQVDHVLAALFAYLLCLLGEFELQFLPLSF